MAKACSSCTKTSIGGPRRTGFSAPVRSSRAAPSSNRGFGKSAVKITFGKKR